MAESAFSEDGKYFSTISKDGRIKIWDTETNVLKQEYTPDLHLTSPPSCLQWLSVSNSVVSPQRGSRRKHSFSEPETQCIALGTTNGKLLIYSITQAKVENVLEDKSGNYSITALDWHRKYGLYSCNKTGYVYEWDLQSRTVRNKYNIIIDNKSKQGNIVSAIKIVPHNQKSPAKYLVTSSWQICVWRLHNGEASVVRHLGHNTAPRALMNLVQHNSNCWLIEGSQNERLLSFWDVTVTEDHLPQVNGDESTPSKRQRRKSVSTPTAASPTYNFVLEDAPKFVDVNLKAENGGSTLTLAAATRSGVVHYYAHMLNGASTKPIKPSVTIQVTTNEACPLPLHCCRMVSSNLLLGYVSGPVVLFERITPDTSSKTQVLIRGESKGKKKKQVGEGKDSLEETGRVTYVEPMGGVTRKRITPGAQVEVPMEARLENLSIDPKSRSKSAVSQNLTKLLMQGLHSKDKNLILMVLQKDDAGVAARTVAKLPADYVPLLLDQLADMAARKTSQCAAACTWLAAALRAHAALLLAAPRAHHLAQLLALFTHRRSHLCQLLNLKGRLDLTVTQRTTRDSAEENQEAVLEYNDTSSDEELEIEQYQSESEQSWGDDGGDIAGEESDDKMEADATDHSDSDGD